MGSGALLAASGAILFLGPNLVQLVSGLFPHSLPENPYLVPERGLLLYVALPAQVTAGLVFFLLPGLLVARGKSNEGPATLLLKGIPAAIGLYAVAHAVVVSVAGSGATTGTFRLGMIGTAFGAWAFTAWRAYDDRGTEALADTGAAWTRWAWFVAIPVLAVQLLLPILFWHDLNPDGLEALTLGRSLDGHLLPRLPTGRGIGLGLGIVGHAFPVHAMTVLFGPIDAAARLPALLYVTGVFAGVTALAEESAQRELRSRELLLLLACVATVTVTLAYNATYHPYSADLASPPAIDLLSMTALLGVALFFWRSDVAWLVVMALLAQFTRPTALLFLAILVVAGFLAREDRYDSWKPALIALIACMVSGVVYETLFPALSSVTLEEPGSGIVGRRLRYLEFGDWRRLLYVVVPSGILPAVSLAWASRHDHLARILALATGLYFAFFYFPAFTALHHYAPAMVLPVTVFGRLLVSRCPLSIQGLGLALAVVAGAFYLSLPRSFEIDRAMRDIGRRTEYRLGDYEGSYDAYREAFEHRGLLNWLFPPLHENLDPELRFMGHAWLQVHYASRARDKPASPDYIVAPLSDSIPSDYLLYASNERAGLWVRSLGALKRDRHTETVVDFRSPLYAIDRSSLLPMWGVPAGNYDVDLKIVVERLAPWLLDAEQP